MVAIGVKYVLLVALLAQASGLPAPAEDKAKAKVLLQEGLAFNRQGAHAQALEKFQAAYAAYPSPKLWFNIAQVQVALDHPVEAALAFEKFLVLVPDAQPEDRKLAKTAVAQLGKKLGRLQIRCETAGAEVVLDGKTVGHVPLPAPLWAMPGSHQVTITHQGFAPANETVEMSAGATALVVIRLVPVPSQPVSQPKAAGPTAKTQAQAAEPIPPPASNLPAPTPTPAAPAALDSSTPSPPAEDKAQARPIYKTWWFWTGAAVVVAGAVTATILLTSQGGSNVPPAELGNHRVFQ